MWRNELGGLTFRVGDRYVKWNPRRTGIDLDRERRRLEWLAGRHPAPRVVDYGEDEDAQWLLTDARARRAGGRRPWRARRSEAIRAIADGLRALHAIPIADVPPEFTAESWVGRAAGVDRGAAADPRAGPRPRRRVRAEHAHLARGPWTGNVDFGDLAVGDRWADLAVASMSLDWNFGEGHQPSSSRRTASSPTRSGSATTAPGTWSPSAPARWPDPAGCARTQPVDTGGDRVASLPDIGRLNRFSREPASAATRDHLPSAPATRPTAGAHPNCRGRLSHRRGAHRSRVGSLAPRAVEEEPSVFAVSSIRPVRPVSARLLALAILGLLLASLLPVAHGDAVRAASALGEPPPRPDRRDDRRQTSRRSSAAPATGSPSAPRPT